MRKGVTELIQLAAKGNKSTSSSALTTPDGHPVEPEPEPVSPFDNLPRHYLEALSLPAAWSGTTPISSGSESPDERRLLKRSQITNELLATETDYMRDIYVIIGVRTRLVE